MSTRPFRLLDEKALPCFNPYMPVVAVPVTGSVLKWAIAEAGLSVPDLAVRLDTTPETINSWISETSCPNKSQFDKLIKELGRPESFFFLARPPSASSSIAKFRKPPQMGSYQPGPEDLKAIRHAEDLQRVARWLAERDNQRAELVKAHVRDSPEEVADNLRLHLEWSTEEQIRQADYQVARALRASIENCGVIALNLTLAEGGPRGFSLPDDVAPVLAINTRDDIRARSFSYIHELAHLSLGDRAICEPVPNSATEQWCDDVAGAFLMPKRILSEYVFTQLHTRKVSEYEEVRQAANKFAVSLRAMAVRLEVLGIGIPGLYNKIHRMAAATPRRAGGAGPPQTRARRRLQRFGHGYINRLFDAVQAGDLDQADLLDLLNLSRKELRELHSLLAGGADG